MRTRIATLAVIALAACGPVPQDRATVRLETLDAGDADAGDADAGPDDAGLDDAGTPDPDAGPDDTDAGPDNDAGPQWDGDAGAPAFDVCNPCGPHVVADVGIVDAGCNAGEVCMGAEPFEQYPDTLCIVATPNGICPEGYESQAAGWYVADSDETFSVCLPPGGCP
jgi:hypothetical protein